jgi:uncharacterized protein with NAD-binding domain and iron-sulfur cluster
MTSPRRVAIIGSGCAALTTAFELTRPELEGRYRVTVYQQGHRLGGKGASSRGVAGRIEEHGLHVWLGFYENAFRLMRDCYAELARDPARCPIADWRDAFRPEPHVGVMDWSETDGWHAWTAVFPALPGLPGDHFENDDPYTVTGYVTRMLEVLRALLIAATQSAEPGESRATRPLEWLPPLLRYTRLAVLAGSGETLDVLSLLSKGSLVASWAPIVAALDRLHAVLRRERASLTEGQPDVRRAWEVIDLVLATFRGLLRERSLFDARGLDSLDEYDIRDWLRKHGAAEESLSSGFVRGLYDLAFAFEAGDIARPGIAAGQALRGALRFFFTYRGSFFWKMQAGMGDVVFAPLYQVLSRRGVRFEFFHRLENLALSRIGAPHVLALELDVQAGLLGDAEYQPLIDVGGLPCWPALPLYEQLVDGERLREEGRDFESFWDRRRVAQKTLHVGKDFDFVVLGVGVAALPHVASELLQRDVRFRDLCENVKTVATQAGQTWVAEDLATLGWLLPPVTLSGFVEPFDTWADMTHLLPFEAWGTAPRKPRSLAYFCSVLADDPQQPARPESGGFVDYPEAARAQVRQNFAEFLGAQVGKLWPNAVRPDGEFRWELLVAADPESDKHVHGSARVLQQFVSANVNPTDRFTLTLPGSTKFRISPLDDTYDNLTVVGDWTACGFNESCVEAAVMSGRLGAHAIAESPRLSAIVGYDHP